MTTAQSYYRYDDVQRCSIDGDGDCYGPGYTTIELREYHVLKTTPKGAWIHIFGTSKRFVLKGTRKRFACPTKQEALESFRARKERQLGILKNQAKRVEQALAMASVMRIRQLEIA